MLFSKVFDKWEEACRTATNAVYLNARPLLRTAWQEHLLEFPRHGMINGANEFEELIAEHEEQLLEID